MFALKRALVLLTAVMVMLSAVPALADSGLRILVSDAEGHEAVMTSFTEDGTAAWWAQIPEECGFSGLKLQISGSDRYAALDGTAFDAPDAGADLLNAAYVPLTVRDTDGADQAAVRLYVSHSPYTPRPDRSYRNVRAVGRWGRINGSNTKLLDDPGAAGRSVGTLDSGTRVLVLYTCRAKGVEYACIRIGDETCYVRSNSIRMLSDAANLAFDMPMLSERRKTEQVKLARTAYKAGLREVLGGSSDVEIAELLVHVRRVESAAHVLPVGDILEAAQHDALARGGADRERRLAVVLRDRHVLAVDPALHDDRVSALRCVHRLLDRGVLRGNLQLSRIRLPRGQNRGNYCNANRFVFHDCTFSGSTPPDQPRWTCTRSMFCSTASHRRRGTQSLGRRDL